MIALELSESQPGSGVAAESMSGLTHNPITIAAL
jgi:hypothetical protein